DCSVVASKRGNACGAKGAGHRHWRGSKREEPDVQWKAAAFVRWHEPDDARVSSPDLVQRGQLTSQRVKVPPTEESSRCCSHIQQRGGQPNRWKPGSKSSRGPSASVRSVQESEQLGRP